ncbi:hypothetical protein Goshw_016238 [Gossypium schwendimanii]|uniref:Uncharacterized protein n=1 Tax=Gossypium schwendimanii TaxID=34291 RepID=A0A7J9M4L5_GOSSC|nr:hypothetical protein [Gossypium schwendimanii]
MSPSAGFFDRNGFSGGDNGGGFKNNRMAHKHAQIGFNFESPQFWEENVPGEATDLVERD